MQNITLIPSSELSDEMHIPACYKAGGFMPSSRSVNISGRYILALSTPGFIV